MKINTSFAAAGLLSANSLAAQLAQPASRVGWWQADTNYASLSGSSITAINDAGNSVSYPAMSAVAGSSPLLTSGAINGLTAASFNGSTQFLTNSAAPYRFVTAGPFTVAMIFKPAAGSAYGYPFGFWTSSNHGCTLGVDGADNMSWTMGNGYLTAPAARGAWHLAICACDTFVQKLRVDGVTKPVASTDNAQPAVGGTPTIGALTAVGGTGFNGLISDTWFFNEDLFATNPKVIGLLERFAAQVYGLGITPYGG